MTEDIQEQTTRETEDKIVEGDPEQVPIKMVQIVPGLSVTLAQFRAAADPLCRFCSQGIATLEARHADVLKDGESC